MSDNTEATPTPEEDELIAAGLLPSPYGECMQANWAPARINFKAEAHMTAINQLVDVAESLESRLAAMEARSELLNNERRRLVRLLDWLDHNYTFDDLADRAIKHVRGFGCSHEQSR